MCAPGRRTPLPPLRSGRPPGSRRTAGVPARVRSAGGADRLVVLLQHLVDLGELGRATDRSHASPVWAKVGCDGGGVGRLANAWNRRWDSRGGPPPAWASVRTCWHHPARRTASPAGASAGSGGSTSRRICATAIDCFTPWSRRNSAAACSGCSSARRSSPAGSRPRFAVRAGSVLPGLVAHDGNVDLGVAEVAGDLDEGHGHVADPRILSSVRIAMLTTSRMASATFGRVGTTWNGSFTQVAARRRL